MSEVASTTPESKPASPPPAQRVVEQVPNPRRQLEQLAAALRNRHSAARLAEFLRLRRTGF